MRVLVDTNILISALFFPGSRVAKTLIYVAGNHEMILCDQNITELREVLARKKPERLSLDIEHPKCMNVDMFLKSEGIEE